MKPLRGMIVSLLVLPVPAAAQSPTPAELVGTWVWSSGVQFQADTLLISEQYVTFAADSTYKRGTIVHSLARSSAGGPWAPTRDVVYKEKKLYQWQLRGDTLTLGRGRDTESYPFELQGQQLKIRLGACQASWERRDLAKPAITLAPATFKRADLAGTWVHDEKQSPDTLWLKADGTLQYVGLQFPPRVKTTGPVSGTDWDVTPGDYLYLPYKSPDPAEKTAVTLFGFGTTVVHEGNQPVIVTNKSMMCSNSSDERKYKRVGP